MKTSSYSIIGLCFLLLLGSFAAPVCQAGFIIGWGDNSHGQLPGTNVIGEFKAVSAGGLHTLGLKTDGTLQGWGNGPDGGTSYIPPTLSNVVTIASGEYWDVALLADGSVHAWGNWMTNGNVALQSKITSVAAGWFHWLAIKDDGTVTGNTIGGSGATNPPAGLANVKAVSAGYEFSLALKANGKVVGWGNNIHGESTPPSGLSNVVAISAGYQHALALKNDGTVVAWGRNESGETNVPVGLSNVVAIAAGAFHSLALTVDGTVVGWGLNSTGQITIPSGLARVTAIAAGRYHSVALTLAGPIDIEEQPTNQLVRFGSNAVFSVVATGQDPLSYQWFFGTNALADNAHISGVNSAALTVFGAQTVDAGFYHVVISNAFGSATSSSAALELMAPPTIVFQSPDQTLPAGSDTTLQVSVSGNAPLTYQWQFDGTNLSGRINSFLTLTNLQPAASGMFSVLVTNLYGSARADIFLTVTDSPPRIVRQPYQMPNQSVSSNFVVGIGGTVSWSVAAKGSLPLSYQWRFNGQDLPGATNASLTLSNLTYGQSGFYNVVVQNPFGEAISAKVSLSVVQVLVSGYSAPTNVPSNVTNVIALAAGGSHVLALRSDRSLVTWGSKLTGYYSPTNIPAGATNIVAVAAGGGTSMALRGDGRVFVWGDNQSLTIVPAAASNNIIAIADGGLHCLALDTNGSIVGWGNRTYGQTTAPYGLSNNVTAISAGYYHSLALKTDGKVIAWGSNSAGQTNVPAGLSNVIAIAAGQFHNLALKSDGRVIAWGSGSFGATNVPGNLSNVVAIAAGYYSSLALKADGTLVTWGNLPPASPAGGRTSISNIIVMAASQSYQGSSFFAAVIGDGTPFFALNPVSQNAIKGAEVQIHARAVGRPAIRYQWQFNGNNLHGATNADLIITNFHSQDSGVYRVVATNILGVAVSSVASVTTLPYSGTLAAALNFTNVNWDTFSTTSKTVRVWFAQNRETHDDDAAAQSGGIVDNQQSTLQTTVTGPGTLTFWWKVSSEEGFDFLRFLLDGVVAPLTGTVGISGEVDWEQKSIVIPIGVHTLRWVYSKDASVSSGQDAGWLDQVLFTPAPPSIGQQPVGRTAVMAENVFFSVSASGVQLNYQWLKNGTNLPATDARILTLNNVSRRDSGTYAVRVSNPGGSILSSNAFLRVRVPQRLGAIERFEDGTFQLTSSDVDNGQVSVDDLTFFEAQYSTNLADWISLPGALQLTNGRLRVLDAPGGDDSMRFYRVIEH